LEDFMNINLKEDVKHISYIKTNAAEMIDYISKTNNNYAVRKNCA